MKKMIRFMTALCLQLSVVFITSCGLIPEEELYESAAVVEPYVPEDYITAECSRMSFEKTEMIYAKYVPVRSEDLAFPLSGVDFDEIYVSVGESVKTGDLLAELDMGTLQSDLNSINQTLSELALSKTQLSEKYDLDLRMLGLEAPYKTVKAQTEDSAALLKAYELSVQSIDDRIYIAELKKASLEAAIEERRIYAPFDGAVTYVYVPEPGESNTAFKRIITLVDTTASLFCADTEYYDHFEPGDEYTVSVGTAEYPCAVVSGEELGITDPENEHPVYLALLEPAFDLEDDQTGKFLMTIESRENVLAVPVHAIGYINGKTVVYYPGEEGIKAYKEVEVGLENSRFIEIKSGLNEGDTVIVN